MYHLWRNCVLEQSTHLFDHSPRRTYHYFVFHPTWPTYWVHRLDTALSAAILTSQRHSPWKKALPQRCELWSQARSLYRACVTFSARLCSVAAQGVVGMKSVKCVTLLIKHEDITMIVWPPALVCVCHGFCSEMLELVGVKCVDCETLLMRWLYACWGTVDNQGKRTAKYSLVWRIQCQKISVKFEFSNINELKTYDTRKTILPIKFEGCSCVRRRSVNCFVFHTLFCLQSFP